MPQYRYPCTKCAYLTHDTPYCPSQVTELAFTTMSISDLNYRARRREEQDRERQGLPPVEVNWWQFRWWWVPVGITVYIVLVILV